MITDVKMRDVPAVVASMCGYRPHTNTVRRWRREGVRNIRLKTIRVGGHYRTSREWIAEFIEATSQSEPDEAEAVQVDAELQRENEKAKARLKTAGVL